MPLDAGIDFFTPAERLFLIKKELDSMRASGDEKIIPGHQDATLYKGKSILRRLISKGIVTHVQPCHDRETLKKLRGNWIMAPSPKHIIKQPIDQLDAYFGLELGLYFQFIEHYAHSLFWERFFSKNHFFETFKFFDPYKVNFGYHDDWLCFGRLEMDFIWHHCLVVCLDLPVAVQTGSRS